MGLLENTAAVLAHKLDEVTLRIEKQFQTMMKSYDACCWADLLHSVISVQVHHMQSLAGLIFG